MNQKQKPIERELAEARVDEINKGNVPAWDKLNTIEKTIFKEAFIEGFQACRDRRIKKKPKSNES